MEPSPTFVGIRIPPALVAPLAAAVEESGLTITRWLLEAITRRLEAEGRLPEETAE